MTYGDSSEVKAEDYQKIAPTIEIPYDTSLDERMRLLGEVFNKEEEAQAVLDSFNAKVEQYKEDFKQAGIYGKSLAIVRPTKDGLAVYGDDLVMGSSFVHAFRLRGA